MMEGLTLQKLSFPIGNLKDQSDFNRIKESLEAIAGVEALTMENGNLDISYYPDAVSAGTVRRTIDSLGYKIEEKSRTKNPFKRFVTRLAESNEKNFGGESLDCCTINKRSPSK